MLLTFQVLPSYLLIASLSETHGSIFDKKNEVITTGTDIQKLFIEVLRGWYFSYVCVSLFELFTVYFLFRHIPRNIGFF